MPRDPVLYGSYPLKQLLFLLLPVHIPLRLWKYFLDANFDGVKEMLRNDSDAQFDEKITIMKPMMKDLYKETVGYSCSDEDVEIFCKAMKELRSNDKVRNFSDFKALESDLPRKEEN